MRIDDATFVRAFGARPRSGLDLEKWKKLRTTVAIYLAELPEPEPGCDRIAVVNTPRGVIGMSGTDGLINQSYWGEIEQAAMTYFGAYPDECTRAIVRCTLPRPGEPIEVDGTVEEVGG